MLRLDLCEESPAVFWLGGEGYVTQGEGADDRGPHREQGDQYLRSVRPASRVRAVS